ncbi:MAG TPA: hypothetical protein VKX96_07650 [Chloroflexota bacterium]|nr:hypothetical protein [Chloroflexota bacterium]
MRSWRDIALDVTLIWIIMILAYLAVGVLRGRQLVRAAWSRLWPERDLFE